MAGEQVDNKGRIEERQRTIGASHKAPKEEVEAHHTRVKDIAEVTSWITSDRWPEKYSSEEMKAQCRRIVKIWEARETDFLLRFPEVNGEFFTELPPEGLAEELAPPLPTSKDDELVSVGGRTSRRRRGRKGKLATVKEEEDREDQTPAPTQATENAAAQETTNLPQGFRKGTNVLYHPLREVTEWLRDFGLVWDERRPRDVVEAAKRAVEDGQAGDEQLLTAQDFCNVVYDGDDPSFVNNDGRVGPHKLGMKPWEDFFLCWNSFKHGCARPNCQYRHLFLCQKECELAIVRGGEKAYQFLLDWASARSWNRTVDLRVLPQAPAVERPAPATPRRGRGRGVAGAVYSARGLSNARAAGQHIRWEQDERSRQCLTENFWRGGKRLLEPERAVESKRRRLSGEEDENLSTGHVDKIKEEEEED